MDQLEHYRDIIERVLTNHADPEESRQPIKSEVIFDRKRDHYLLLHMGWQGDRRIHGIVAQIDLIDGKVWIQRDGIEYGIAQDLLDAGVPKEHIVLGFKSPELRQYTDFAIA